MEKIAKINDSRATTIWQVRVVTEVEMKRLYHTFKSVSNSLLSFYTLLSISTHLEFYQIVVIMLKLPE